MEPIRWQIKPYPALKNILSDEVVISFEAL